MDFTHVWHPLPPPLHPPASLRQTQVNHLPQNFRCCPTQCSEEPLPSSVNRRDSGAESMKAPIIFGRSPADRYLAPLSVEAARRCVVGTCTPLEGTNHVTGRRSLDCRWYAETDMLSTEALGRGILHHRRHPRKWEQTGCCSAKLEKHISVVWVHGESVDRHHTGLNSLF